jgi:hypothetical protein
MEGWERVSDQVRHRLEIGPINLFLIKVLDRPAFRPSILPFFQRKKYSAGSPEDPLRCHLTNDGQLVRNPWLQHNQIFRISIISANSGRRFIDDPRGPDSSPAEVQSALTPKPPNADADLFRHRSSP